MLCAGGKAGEDSCGVSAHNAPIKHVYLTLLSKGDSGGPLTVDVDGQHVLVGDTSFGLTENCAQVRI